MCVLLFVYTRIPKHLYYTYHLYTTLLYPYLCFRIFFTQLYYTHIYATGSLCVGNIDNAIPPSDKIVTGSLKGKIRIYNPTKDEYKLEDLLLEDDLGSPILQMLIGKIIPSSLGALGLAVLHPFSLVVYEVCPQGASGNKTSYYSLEKLYQHALGLEGKHFTAFNMVCGGFGGVRGKDILMVQSMDGKLQFFEDSAIAFTR